MKPITFTVHGRAIGQGSKRHVGHGIMVDSPKLKPWRQMVGMYARQAYSGPLLDCAVEVKLTFYEPRPRSHFGKRGLKPSAPPAPHKTRTADGDKLVRAFFDAITGVLVTDDKRIVDHVCRKRYGQSAYVYCVVQELDPDTLGDDRIAEKYANAAIGAWQEDVESPEATAAAE